MSILLVHSNEPDIGFLLKHLQIPYGPQFVGSSSYDAVIQWGSAGLQASKIVNVSGDTVKVLNPGIFTERALDKKRMRNVLVCNGLQVYDKPASSETIIHSHIAYFVPVFHLDALAVFRGREGSAAVSKAKAPNLREDPEEIRSDPRHSLYRRLTSAAVRAVYCLGLDFGYVSLRLESMGRISVADVQPIPPLNERLGCLYADAIQRYAADWSSERVREERPLMGMDPEFILRKPNGRVVSASRYLHKNGRAGCDAIVYRGGEVIYPLAELRPVPAADPRQLMLNLIRTMKLAATKIADSELEWIAGGMPSKGFPLGGHLHLSGIWLNNGLLRALDNYVALPLILIEDETTRGRRPRYGFAGDFRRQPHGGFEYRTLPSWIVSPRIAKGVLALTRIIADHYLELSQRPLDEEPIQRFYYSGEKDPLAPVVRSLWADLEHLSAYDTYRSYLEPLKRQIMRQTPWNEQRDMRKLWKIPPFGLGGTNL
jgi:hypothetical protein